jgi:hypothetical protein
MANSIGAQKCTICGKEIKARGMKGHLRLGHQLQTDKTDKHLTETDKETALINKIWNWDNSTSITSKSIDNELDRIIISLLELRSKINGINWTKE